MGVLFVVTSPSTLIYQTLFCKELKMVLRLKWRTGRDEGDNRHGLLPF